jgi:glycosyltransferase involved in cell wall biosynthesis
MFLSAKMRSEAGGVNVIGPLRAESGVGQAARAVVEGLDAAGVALLPLEPAHESPSRQEARIKTFGLARARFDTNLICLTALETEAFASGEGAEVMLGRRNIGVWWWEVDRVLELMLGAFGCVDEVWAGSGHVADALRAVAGPVPVRQVRLPVRAPRAAAVSREQLGLPPGPLLLSIFGYYSSVVRKNPAGVIEAFTRAFATGEGPQLVLKCIDHEAHPVEHGELSELVAQRPDIHLLEGYADQARMDALLAAADVVVSLHRAEGFGFTGAEAMSIGKPVIATRYSGNLDYMTDENSFLVDATLRPIGAEGAPYPADGHWADPDLDQAAAYMRLLLDDPARLSARGAVARADMAAAYGPLAAGTTMRAALGDLAPGRAGLVTRALVARAARARRA